MPCPKTKNFLASEHAEELATAAVGAGLLVLAAIGRNQNRNIDEMER